jgi:ATP-binding cassette subfamily B protein
MVDGIRMFRKARGPVFHQTGVGVVEERQKRQDGVAANIKAMWRYMAEDRRQLALAFCLMLFRVAARMPMPLLTMYIIDNLIVPDRYRQVYWICGGLLIVLILQSAAVYMEERSIARLRYGSLERLKARLYARLLDLPVQKLDRTGEGYLVARIDDDPDSMQNLFGGNAITIASNVITFLVGLVFIFRMNTTLSIAALVILPFYVSCIVIMNRRARIWMAAAREAKAEYVRNLYSHIRGARVTKAYAYEERDTAHIRSAIRHLNSSLMNSHLYGIRVSIMVNGIGTLCPIIVLAVGVTEVVHGRLTVGGLVAFNSFVGYLMSPMHLFSSLNAQLQNSLVCLDRIETFLGGDTAVAPGCVTAPVSQADANCPAVTIEGITCRYENSDRPALNGLSIKVARGEFVAVVGRSGSGKSTLLKALLGFVQPDVGRILINGRGVQERNREILRSEIAYAAQDDYLFDYSLRDNIGMGKVEASECELIVAVKRAQAVSVVKAKPGGLDAIVGAAGWDFSGGEKRRLTLARAFLKDVGILVLDEPTEGLDPVAIDGIIEGLAELRGERTLIVVTHDLRVAGGADRFIVLEDGRAVYDGPDFDVVQGLMSQELGGTQQDGHEMAMPEKTLRGR